MKRFVLLAVALVLGVTSLMAQHKTLREWGFPTGIFETGRFNAITDVPGVTVGHVTLIEGDSVRTGVTAIVPHQGNIFRQKVPAAIYVGNGFGKLVGVTQVRELGNIETPIVLTNTLSVAAGIEGVVRYTLAQPGNEQERSVNAVVGETNDGRLNDIRGMHVTPQMVSAGRIVARWSRAMWVLERAPSASGSRVASARRRACCPHRWAVTPSGCWLRPTMAASWRLTACRWANC